MSDSDSSEDETTCARCNAAITESQWYRCDYDQCIACADCVFKSNVDGSESSTTCFCSLCEGSEDVWYMGCGDMDFTEENIATRKEVANEMNAEHDACRAEEYERPDTACDICGYATEELHYCSHCGDAICELCGFFSFEGPTLCVRALRNSHIGTNIEIDYHHRDDRREFFFESC